MSHIEEPYCLVSVYISGEWPTRISERLEIICISHARRRPGNRERSMYRIEWFNRTKRLIKPYFEGVISRTITYGAIRNRTGELGCFIL